MTIFQVLNCSLKKHCSFEDYIVEFARKAKEKGIALHIVLPAITLQGAKEAIESYGARIHIVRGRWERFSFVKQLLSIAVKEKAGVLDFHLCTAPIFALLFLLLRLRGKKVLFHYHGEIKPLEELTLKNHHFSKLRFVTFFVDEIICVSHANRKYLEALNIRTKIRVIYNGIKAENFLAAGDRRDFRKEAGFNNGELIVSYIGSLIPRKGIDVLLRAAQKVTGALPQARFVVVGGGKKERYERLAADLGIKDKVVFTGFLEDYPYHILRASDVFASASYAESYGYSSAEAQIMGIPVVATAAGGTQEVVNDGTTGILVSRGDVDGLAEEIIRVLRDENVRKELGKNGPAWIKNKFNLPERIEEIIDACLR